MDVTAVHAVGDVHSNRTDGRDVDNERHADCHVHRTSSTAELDLCR